MHQLNFFSYFCILYRPQDLICDYSHFNYPYTFNSKLHLKLRHLLLECSTPDIQCKKVTVRWASIARNLERQKS